MEGGAVLVTGDLVQTVQDNVEDFCPIIHDAGEGVQTGRVAEGQQPAKAVGGGGQEPAEMQEEEDWQ